MTKLQARNSKAPNTSFSKLDFKIWNLFVIYDLNIGFSCHLTMCAPFPGVLGLVMTSIFFLKGEKRHPPSAVIARSLRKECLQSHAAISFLMGIYYLRLLQPKIIFLSIIDFGCPVFMHVFRRLRNDDKIREYRLLLRISNQIKNTDLSIDLQGCGNYNTNTLSSIC